MSVTTNWASNLLLIIALSLVMPLLLLPLETLFPFPYIFEEIAKAVLVLLIINQSRTSRQIILLVLSGFFFSLSEGVLFLGHAFSRGNPTLFFPTFFSILVVHSLTLSVIYFPTHIKREFIFLGLIAAILIHYHFNATSL
jgi:hypothetical protein